jgi:hypothetical protein
MVFTGCVFNEKKPHGVNFVYSGISSIGYSGNQAGLQEINWSINLTNTGDRAAEGANASVILHPEIASRLNYSSLNSVISGNLPPGSTVRLNGMVVFNATGLSKQDIAGWKPLVSIKLTWVEDGIEKEQIIEIN